MIQTSFPLVDNILEPWRGTIGEYFEGYKNHVYRTLNFCYIMQDCTAEEKQILEIAASFHDIGVWSDKTFTYLEPSVAQAKKWLEKNDLSHWQEDVSLIIYYHHKITKYKNLKYPLVELYRKADLIDASMGIWKFSVTKTEYKETVKAIAVHNFFKKMFGAAEFSDLITFIFKVLKR